MAEFTTTVSNEDVPVNKMVPELCACCILVVTLGARLLLPFPASPSTADCCGHPAAESLVTSSSCLTWDLWNRVSLFSNLSLIFLMPAGYFFMESEGFAGSRKISRARSDGSSVGILYQPQRTATRPAANRPVTSRGHVLRPLLPLLLHLLP